MTTATDFDGWMKPEQVCDYLQVERAWVYDQVEAGKMPHVKLGRLLRFRRSELDAWVEDQRRV